MNNTEHDLIFVNDWKLCKIGECIKHFPHKVPEGTPRFKIFKPLEVKPRFFKLSDVVTETELFQSVQFEKHRIDYDGQSITFWKRIS